MSKSRIKDLLFASVILFLGGILIGQFLPSRHRLGGEPLPPALGEDEASPAPPEKMAELGASFRAIARKVTPSVVNINTTQIIPGSPFAKDPFFRQFFGQDWADMFPDRKVQNLGSGVIVSSEGYVLTNHHVIQGADEITVSLADKRTFQAHLVGTDPMSDVAVLRIEPHNLKAVQWGDSDLLEVGDWVVAIGNPYGLSHTVTAGIVSAKGRIDVGISGYEDFIQTDAAINPGNSGGALIDINQKLVGINTAIFSESGGYQGIGFAIPSNMARKIMQELIQNGRVTRGWLGIIVRPLTSDLAAQLGLKGLSGVVVDKLYRNQPAHRAGLLPLDVILAYNDQVVESPGYLRNKVAEAKIGSKVKLKVWREGQLYVAEVEVGEHPTDAAGRPAPGI
jgi:serine protease Do